MRCPSCKIIALVLIVSTVLVCSDSFAQTNAGAEGYIQAVRSFADTVVSDGRDTYGRLKTPLFVDGLQVESLEPVRWQRKGEIWVLCNVASQQPLLRILDGLTALTGERRYRQAAEDAKTEPSLASAMRGSFMDETHVELRDAARRPFGSYAPYYRWRFIPQAKSGSELAILH